MPGESGMLQEELQEAKQQTTELQAAAMLNGTSSERRKQIWPQVEHIEAQKRLERELLRWKLIHKG